MTTMGTKSHLNWRETVMAVWVLLSLYPMYYFLWSQNYTAAKIVAGYTGLSSVRDTFKDYKQSETCSLSSLELHKPFRPLCDEKDTDRILQAITGGGRIGIDAPFQTRDCDMRWFTTEEICEILSRFERVSVIGDSMMRNLAIAFQVFLRKDIVDGGWQSWAPPPEGLDCSCEAPWDSRECGWNIVVNSDQVYSTDPGLMACPMDNTAFFRFHSATANPPREDQMESFEEDLPPRKTAKPVAFVFGLGLWDELELNKTEGTIDQLMDAAHVISPWLFEPGQLFPRLFITPSAAHAAKPEMFWGTQGNLALTRFEQGMAEYVRREQGIDHLGTYNMSIQATSWDGTHAGRGVNLIKAMAVLNWLNSLDHENW